MVIHILHTIRASQKSRSCRGKASARFSFAVLAPFAFPKGRQKAQELQKIFPVAAGDHAHRQHTQLKVTFERPCTYYARNCKLYVHFSLPEHKRTGDTKA